MVTDLGQMQTLFASVTAAARQQKQTENMSKREKHTSETAEETATNSVDCVEMSISVRPPSIQSWRRRVLKTLCLRE